MHGAPLRIVCSAVGQADIRVIIIFNYSDYQINCKLLENNKYRSSKYQSYLLNSPDNMISQQENKLKESLQVHASIQTSCWANYLFNDVYKCRLSIIQTPIDLGHITNLYMSKNKGKAAPAQPPKRALTAFFLYRQEVYDEVKKDNPEARITEITKIIGEMWRNADQQTKDRLTRLYNKNKDNYEEQKEFYQKKYGKIQIKKKGRQTK